MFRIREHTHYLEVFFADPASANALSLNAARELARLQKSHAKWRQAFVLRSDHPRFFCSGGNLSDYQKLKTRTAGIKVNREITRILDRFAAWPITKLAVVEGDVFGGGLEWLARFDWRWACVDVLLAFWQRRLGLTFGWGGGRAWAEILGERITRGLLDEERILSAFEAQRLGLLDRVLARQSVEREIGLWAAFARAPSGWSSTRESRLFAQQWLAPEHRRVLEGWKKKKAT